MVGGEAGPAIALAARLVVRLATIMGADRLVPITGAHVDGCLYHGPVSTDFARRLVDGGGAVRVPTTLNVGSVDLLHPTIVRGDPAVTAAGRELMRLYAALGCRPTWTCAPYQLMERPGLGEHVAWAESNAIVFANSVLGARTERYGDFIDIAAGIVGRAPHAGLHRDDRRVGRVLFRLRSIPPRLAAADVLFATLGHYVGRRSGTDIPVIEGIDLASEDQLKAFGAAAAASGSVAMFHWVGVTPEAPTLAAACGGALPPRAFEVRASDLRTVADALNSARGERLGAVSIGTPHFSLAEFEQLLTLLDGRRVSARIEFFVSTGRGVLETLTARGWLEPLTRSGIRLVTDTCTYVTPILTPTSGAVMTNSAKWAWYAPTNLGVPVIFGSLAECVESGVRGAIWRDPSLWHDGN